MDFLSLKNCYKWPSKWSQMVSQASKWPLNDIQMMICHNNIFKSWIVKSLDCKIFSFKSFINGFSVTQKLLQMTFKMVSQASNWRSNDLWTMICYNDIFKIWIVKSLDCKKFSFKKFHKWIFCHSKIVTNDLQNGLKWSLKRPNDL